MTRKRRNGSRGKQTQTSLLTLYPDAEHDSWTETYNNPELYTWLLQHTR